MNIQIEKNIKQLLGEIWKPGDLVIAWKNASLPGHRIPAFIMQKEEIQDIVFDSFCDLSLAKYINSYHRKEILPATFKGKIHIVCKPCDAKSVMQAFADEQIAEEMINLIVVECDGVIDLSKIEKECKKAIESYKEEDYTILCKDVEGKEYRFDKREYWLRKCADTRNCDLPYYYGYYFVGNEKEYKQRIRHYRNTWGTLPQDTMPSKELRNMIYQELQRCIRCNACRNICPACFCADQCIFDKPKENVNLLDNDTSTENTILYHMIRFHHVAPNCTGCGECERACPKNIPLHIFYEYFNRLMEEEFDYQPGKTNDERQKLLSYNLGEDLV
jgi:NAD-dependent dihydropyrimidine dehydrogenase PreA subunit